MEQALIVANSVLLVTFLAFGTCFLQIFYDIQPYYIFKLVANKGIKNISTIFFIPILVLLCIDIKYYFLNEQIAEYSLANSSYGNPLSLFRSSLSLSVLLVSNFVFENFAYEIKHIAKGKEIDAKAHSKVDLKSKIMGVLITILNLSIFGSHPQLYQVIFLLVSLFFIFQYMVYLPYYLPFTNKLKIIGASVQVLMALGFLIGYIVDDSFVILVFALFVIPCMCILMNWVVDYRYS